MFRKNLANLKTFHKYNLLHSYKTTSYENKELTVLLKMKETPFYYTSISVWAFCTSSKKIKKPFSLSYNIPVITDDKSISLLKNKGRRINPEDSDQLESFKDLKSLFPLKKIYHLYDLEKIITKWYHGMFDRNIHLPTLKYLNHDFFIETDDIISKEWVKKINLEKDKDTMLNLYSGWTDYIFENFNLIETFKDIGQHAVCYPTIFTKNTANWSLKNGRYTEFAHAGEIWFVQTEDSIYFDITRHF
jgi:hypothetical protein